MEVGCGGVWVTSGVDDGEIVSVGFGVVEGI